MLRATTAVKVPPTSRPLTTSPVRPGSQAGALTPMASATRQYFAQVEAQGHAEDYVPWIADHIARMNGLDLEEEAKKGRD